MPHRHCFLFPLIVGLSATTTAFGTLPPATVTPPSTSLHRRLSIPNPPPSRRATHNNGHARRITTQLTGGNSDNNRNDDNIYNDNGDEDLSSNNSSLEGIIEPSTEGVPEPPPPEKSKEQQAQDDFIREALLDNPMFETMPEDTLSLLVDSFEKTYFTQGQSIIRQGEPGGGEDSYVYLTGEGDCTVVVDGKVAPEPYGTLKSGAIFGEVGVLYNQTRKASILAKSDTVTVYRVRGDTFKSVLDLDSSDDDPDLFEKIEQAINAVAGTKTLYEGTIVRQYKPNRSWLWRRWYGTVFQHSWRTVAINMLISFVFNVIAQKITGVQPGAAIAPDKSHPFVARLEILRKLWGYQMSLTTFILTFFVNQAYSFWTQMYTIARKIQGRMNDFNCLLATSCKRNPDGTTTADSEKLMDDIGAYSRVFHALLWASFAKRLEVLRTPKGLQRMASRGLMSSKQLNTLLSLDIPNNQLHNAVLEWMMIRAWKGIDDGVLRNDISLSQSLLNQMCELRSTYYGIGGMLSCRLPLPYTHFVQILVDSFLILAPFALYAELGVYSTFCVGVLTLFYSGLSDRK